MLNNTETEQFTPVAENLRVSAPLDQEQRLVNIPLEAPLHPGLLIRQKTTPAPKKLLPRVAFYWRKDPAYKVFMVAVAMTVVASMVFISLASASLFGVSIPSTSYTPKPPTNVIPKGTVDLQPGFPKPGGGTGSDQSSQPPPQSNAVPGATTTAQPNPTNQPGGPLNVQITNFSPVVVNGSHASVTVSTNQPGVQVFLQISYNVRPYQATGGPQTTDGNGVARIRWTVRVAASSRGAQATVTAIAVDQNGQQVSSNPVTITIVTF